jgi:hypothetical protein
MAEAFKFTNQSAEDYSKVAIWNGVEMFNQSTLKQYDQAYTGFAHIFVLSMPAFLESATIDADKKARCKNLRYIIQNGCTSATGIGNAQMQFAETTSGFSDVKLNHATILVDDFDTLTLKIPEFYGLPTHAALKDWLYGISDPITKVGDYYGQTTTADGSISSTLRRSIGNHSASFLLVHTGPDFASLQGDAVVFTNCIPVELPQEHQNYTKGEVEVLGTYDIPFKATKLPSSAAINTLARNLLKAKRSLYSWYSWDLKPDFTAVDTTNLQSGYTNPNV